MVPPQPKTEHPPSAVDDLLARVEDAERRIAEALTPEPVDWEAHYRDVLSDAAAAGRRVGALAEGGA